MRTRATLKSRPIAKAAGAAHAPRIGDPALSGRKPLSPDAPQRDQQLILLKARRAERALALASLRLLEVIEAVSVLHRPANTQPLAKLVAFAAQLRVLGLHLRDLFTQVGDAQPEIGREVLEFRIAGFLAQASEAVEQPKHLVDHLAYLRAAQNLLGWMERVDWVREEYHDIAIALFQEAVRGRWPDRSNAPVITEALEEGR